jgi:hypothetical protein
MSFWGHRGVTYAQPRPNESFAFYDYLLSWGASVGETAGAVPDQPLLYQSF